MLLVVGLLLRKGEVPVSDSEEHLVAVERQGYTHGAMPSPGGQHTTDVLRKNLQREILSILRRQTKLAEKLERKRKELRELPMMENPAADLPVSDLYPPGREERIH
jgi:hypothetical protein